MAKTAREFEIEFLETIVETTGDNLDGWMAIIKSSGLSKVNEIIKWLKQTHGLNHLQSNMLASIYLNDGKPVHDYEALFNKLISGKETQLPLYRAVETLIQAKMPQVQFVPTKTYVSLDGERCFGTIKINKTNIRIGLDLGDRAFGDYVQKAKSLGAMPRISHMIEIHKEQDVNEHVLKYLQQSFSHVHK
jgi:hypothetical protein